MKTPHCAPFLRNWGGASFATKNFVASKRPAYWLNWASCARAFSVQQRLCSFHGCYVQGQCGNLLKWRRGRKCEPGTMAGYEDAMSNTFASLFLFLPSDSRKTSDCLKFSGLPSFEQYQDVPCRSKNAGSTISGLRWSPKHFQVVLTLLPWSFARQVVSFPMSTKFSAFYRCMLQLGAFCGCSFALQDCGSSCRLAIDGMSCGRLQALFPFQRYALPGKRL